MGAHAEKIRAVADRGKFRSAKQLNGDRFSIGGKIQFHILDIARQITDHQDTFILIGSGKCQDLGVIRMQKFQISAAKGLEPFSQADEAPHPPQRECRFGNNLRTKFFGVNIKNNFFSIPERVGAKSKRRCIKPYLLLPSTALIKADLRQLG